MAPPLRRRLKRSKLPNNINLLLILSVCITVISFYVGSPRITALKETTLLVSEQDENVDSGRLDSLGNVKGGMKLGTHAYWIWAVDADVPPDVASVLRSVAEDDSVGRVHAYCGTKQCYTMVEALKNENIQLRFLRVAELSHYTGMLQSHLSSQEMLSILRLRLPGVLFEELVQIGAVLGVLWRAVNEVPGVRHFYFDPLLPLCSIRKLISSLPVEEHIPWLITYAESSSVPSSELSWAHSFFLGSDSIGSKMVLTEAALRLESKLHLPRGEELLHQDSLERDWGRTAVCEDAEGYCFLTSHIDFDCAQRHRIQLSRYFHLPGYGSHAGCAGNPGSSLRQRYEFAEGDVYQTLSALQFLPRVDGFIDINVGYPSFEEVRNMPDQTWKHGSHSVRCDKNGCLRNFGASKQKSTLGGCPSEWTTEWPMPPRNNGTIYFITAGRWFEHFDGDTKYSWPPPSHITPIFIGHRIERPPSNKVLQWLKMYEGADGHGAIGVRDVFSQNILCKKGVRPVFTGDLTLGLRTLLDSSLADESILQENEEILFFMPGHVKTNEHNCNVSNIGSPKVKCVSHHWQLVNSTIWHLGREYDLVYRSHRHQVALETLRRLQKSMGAVTTKQFHVLIPSLGLNKSVGFYGNIDNRLMGYEQAIPPKSKGVQESIHDLVQAGKPTIKAEHLRRELVVRTRTLLARGNPSILDAMHRLGPFVSYSQKVDDEAWMSGQLPLSLMEGFSANDLLNVTDTFIDCNE